MIEQHASNTRDEAEQHVADWCECHGMAFNPAEPITVAAIESVEATIRTSGPLGRQEAFAVIQRVMLAHIDAAITLTPGDMPFSW